MELNHSPACLVVGPNRISRQTFLAQALCKYWILVQILLQMDAQFDIPKGCDKLITFICCNF